VAQKNVFVKKDVKSKVAAKNWLWWQAKGKNFNNDNLGEFDAESLWNMEKATQIYLNHHY